ncbi:response regulator transcription factor [Ligilactobacillus sp. Marseille-Q7487]|uniref:response regulator n=1 Tax=Ligilactobacillus sp. Marseille-Q7487 TaxID=3022128 RepID=UPI0024A97695|nr:response regulator transcription factor [Ligilactobacillus sp. Marseille-Q7487]
MATLKILLVEDEDGLASFIQTELEFEGYQVKRINNGKQALQEFEEFVPDLILLDWMLPGYDGITVARRIRRQSEIPIIMMTAKNQTSDIVTGLDAGLDDYLTKPFEIEELFARIRVIERRLAKKESTNNVLEYVNLKLDLAKHQIEVAGKMVELTPKEFGILYELLKTPEEVKTRDELLNSVWGYEYFGQTNVVDVYIRTLRNKLGTAGELIQTVRGIGYVLRK